MVAYREAKKSRCCPTSRIASSTGWNLCRRTVRRRRQPVGITCGLATPGVHIHRWYEARSHHGGSRFDDRGIVRREHQQRSAHASAHAEKGARVALLSTVPIVKLVEEHGRDKLIEPWMEQRLLAVTG